MSTSARYASTSSVTTALRLMSVRPAGGRPREDGHPWPGVAPAAGLRPIDRFVDERGVGADDHGVQVGEPERRADHELTAVAAHADAAGRGGPRGDGVLGRAVGG